MIPLVINGNMKCVFTDRLVTVLAYKFILKINGVFFIKYAVKNKKASSGANDDELRQETLVNILLYCFVDLKPACLVSQI